MKTGARTPQGLIPARIQIPPSGGLFVCGGR
jgi:hypothetical protein